METVSGPPMFPSWSFIHLGRQCILSLLSAMPFFYACSRSLDLEVGEDICYTNELYDDHVVDGWPYNAAVPRHAIC